MNPRRELAIATIACAVGAGLALWAASRTWVVVATVRAAPQPPLATPRSGGDITPLLAALALVALASAGGLLATRGWARTLVGAVMALAGLGIAVEAVRAGGAEAGISVVWPVLCGVGALLVLGAAGLTLRRGRAWPAMGARYERPADTVRAGTASGMWDAIDRGHDPTEDRSDAGESNGQER